MNAAKIEAMAADLGRLAAIDDLEMFASAVAPGVGAEPEYHILSRSKGADMLKWSAKVRGVPELYFLHIQIQDIGDGLARIGAIGDGNCMVHSLFTAASPTYRRQDMETRQAIADKFRDVLVVRLAELRVIADDIYAEIGGSVAFEESFSQLEGAEEANRGGAIRSEIDIALGPVIARLYNFNFLAVRLNDRLEMMPVKQSLYGRDPSLPTIFIHYMGGATDFGAVDEFGGQGHYEVIVRPVIAAGASRRKTTAGRTLPSSGTIQLDESATTFMFTDTQLADVLARFGNLNAANMNENVAAAIVAAAERKRTEGRELSPATLRTLAAIERKRATIVKKISSPRPRSPVVSEKPRRVSTRKATTTRRRTTRKKSSDSHSRSVSPNTLAAIAALELNHRT